MKLFVKFLTLILVCCIFTSCANNKYRMIVDGSNYYIVLDENIVTNSSPTQFTFTDTSGNNWMAYIDPPAHGGAVVFHSISEMVCDITDGTFTEEELQIIGTFQKDNAGRIIVCNLDTLYEPVFPNSYDHYNIRWTGESLSYSVLNSDESKNVFLGLYSQEYWQKCIGNLENFKDRISKDNVITQHERQRNATIYLYPGYDEDRKDCIYSFTNANETYFVHEVYDLAISSVIPKTITIYGISQGQCFYVSIIEPNERPSIEWLAQFGLKIYIPNCT